MNGQTNRETDRQINGQTNRQTHSWTNRLPNRKKETPTDGQTDTEAHMQIYPNKRELQLTLVLWNFVLIWENYDTMEKV